jgi:hypothetical protein
MVYFKKLSALKKIAILFAIVLPILAFAHAQYSAPPSNNYGLQTTNGMPFAGAAPNFAIQLPATAAAGFWKFSAPVATPAVGNGFLVSTATVQNPEFPLNALGTFGSTAASTIIAFFEPINAGHIASLAIANLSTSSCATAPTINVIDYLAGNSASSTPGTALAGPTTGGMSGTSIVKNSQSLTFAGGDTVLIFVQSAGSGCTGSTFAVSAELSTP